MVNHYWNGKEPAQTACRDYYGDTVPYISAETWGIVSCPECLEYEPLTTPQDTNLSDERADIIARFTAELTKVTGDGSRKRQAGTKPPWYEDDSHEGAIFSHLTKWKRGELVDPDSGAHPLVHLAWRALAIALRETSNTPNQ